MPILEKVYQANYGMVLGNTNTNLANGSILSLRHGFNDAHCLSGGWRFSIQGPNCTDGDPAPFDVGQITKIEFRLNVQNPNAGNFGGVAPYVTDAFMLVPDHGIGVGTGTSRPNYVYDLYDGVAANNVLASELFALWPNTSGWTDWYQLDDGTDLATAIGVRPDWDTATDIAGGASLNAVVVIKIGASGSGQWYNLNNYQTAFKPEIRISYDTPPALNFISGGSVSGDDNAPITLVGAPECFGRWHGDKPEILGKEALFPYSTTGSGDLPPTGKIGGANPNSDEWALWTGGGPQPTTSKLRIRNNPAFDVVGDVPNSNYCIYHEAYASKTVYSKWDVDYWRDKSNTLKTASGQFMTNHTGLPSSGSPNPVILQAYLEGALVWVIEFRTWTIDNRSHEVRLWNYVDGFGTAWSDTRYPFAHVFRWEFQVSNDAPIGEKLKVRMYLGSGVSPLEEFMLDCSNVEFDEIRFGTNNGSVTPLVNVYLNNVELWDDYYLNGKWRDPANIGILYNFGEWEQYEYDGVSINPIDYYGVVTQEDPLIIDTTPIDPLRDYEGYRWPYSGPSNTDPTIYNYSLVNYSNHGSAKHRMDLYTPTGTPPSEGWPLLIWLHGGFFVAGNRSQMPKGMVVDLVQAGWAVASLDIILSSTTPVVNIVAGTGSVFYPAWDPAADTARHPTQILDFKMAVEFMQRSAQKSTYNLSGLVVAAGHSAGGFPASMSMLTKDIADEGSGLSYRLQDHQIDYGYPNVADPDIAGVYVWSPPTDLEVMDEFDFTRRAGLTYMNTSQYTMETTIQLYWGINWGEQPTALQFAGSKMSQMVADQTLSNIKPMVYAGGESDHLVPSAEIYQKYGWDQAQLVKDAFVARGIGSLMEIRRHAEVQHYQTPYRYDSEHLRSFIENIRLNS